MWMNVSKGKIYLCEVGRRSLFDYCLNVCVNWCELLDEKLIRMWWVMIWSCIWMGTSGIFYSYILIQTFAFIDIFDLNTCQYFNIIFIYRTYTHSTLHNTRIWSSMSSHANACIYVDPMFMFNFHRYFQSSSFSYLISVFF